MSHNFHGRQEWLLPLKLFEWHWLKRGTHAGYEWGNLVWWSRGGKLVLRWMRWVPKLDDQGVVVVATHEEGRGDKGLMRDKNGR